MTEYMVVFDMSDPQYYQAAAKELDTRENRRDYGLGYKNLIQLFDENAVLTTARFGTYDVGSADENMRWIVETVHDHLIYPGSYSINRMHELGETMAGIMEMLCPEYYVTFASDVDLDHLRALAHKYALPEPVPVEEG